ncbi:MAG: immunoglobulin domain-containing protein, partial [Phycisphaerales bacterium]
ARWTGAAWVPVGGPLGFVSDMCVWNNQLVVCGSLSGAATGRVAAFNGSTWSTLGATPNDTVAAVAVHNGELYIGGWFTTAGGFGARNHVARWTGSAWAYVGPSLGSNGVSGNVNDMISYNGELYVGGSFSDASGTPVSGIARWNGSAWRDLAGAMGGSAGQVLGLSAVGGRLAALGTFQYCGTTCIDGVGLWDGASWSRLGGQSPGTLPPHYPQVAAEHEGLVYFGGNVIDWYFRGSAHVGRWSPLPVIATQPEGVEVCRGGSITLSAALAWPSYTTATWRRNGAVVVNGGRVNGANSTLLTISDAQFGDSGAYVCEITNDCGSTFSVPAQVFVRSAPGASRVSPSNTVVLQGFAATLEVSVVSTTAYTAQWFRNDVPVSNGLGGAAAGGGTVSGANAVRLVIAGSQPADAGVYTCLATNLCGEDLSEPISLVVAPRCPWSGGCFADYDASGGIDSDDVIVFFTDWDGGDACADVDGSGGVDSDDVIAFFTAWDGGGC